MNLRTNLETYELYEGRSPHEVATKHEDNQKYWRFSLFNTKKSKQFRVNPFEDSCIGVYMNQHSNQFQYKMIMTQNSIDTWKIAMMGLGMFLFWYAGKLSRNTLFYYVSGVTIGVSLSIVILIYLLGKLLPKVGLIIIFDQLMIILQDSLIFNNFTGQIYVCNGCNRVYHELLCCSDGLGKCSTNSNAISGLCDILCPLYSIN